MKRFVLCAVASVLLLVSSVEARADHRHHSNHGCNNNSGVGWHSFAGQGWYNGTQTRSPVYRSYTYRVPSYGYGYGGGYGNYGNYGYGNGYGNYGYGNYGYGNRVDNYGYGGCGNGYGYGNSNFRIYFGF